MPVQLKPGGMGLWFPAARGGIAESMAARMEEALNELLDDDGLRTLPTHDNPETRDRRRLLVAIARGLSGIWRSAPRPSRSSS
jgi:hypothetical protein